MRILILSFCVCFFLPLSFGQQQIIKDGDSYICSCESEHDSYESALHCSYCGIPPDTVETCEGDYCRKQHVHDFQDANKTEISKDQLIGFIVGCLIVLLIVIKFFPSDKETIAEKEARKQRWKARYDSIKTYIKFGLIILLVLSFIILRELYVPFYVYLLVYLGIPVLLILIAIIANQK